MRILSIDLGQKRTGLAVCDPGETFVSPLAVLENKPDIMGKIFAVIRAENIQAVVVGLAINMDGTEGPQAAKARRFAEQLKEQIDLPVYLHDERLSSYDAERKLLDADLTRKKMKKRLDALAAAAILQDFLDSGKKQ
ncbi:MAG: Holliday junction resolvase RuvX [Planctomycetota bacterium]